jgi:hypothetical protein
MTSMEYLSILTILRSVGLNADPRASGPPVEIEGHVDGVGEDLLALEV